MRQGKVRFIGCSNFPAWRLADADWTARHHGLAPFVTCQSEYSLVARGIERELMPAMQHYGIGLLPSYPLAAGLLTGKYRRGAMPDGARLTTQQRLAQRYLTEDNWALTERLEAFCERRGRTLLELAFACLLANPVVSSVIAGATRAEQVEHNVRAGEWALSPDEIEEIRRLLSGDAVSAPERRGEAERTRALTH